MDAATCRYSIGELSRLTGLPVRTIRFYSDSGLVPEAGRTLAERRRMIEDFLDDVFRGLDIDPKFERGMRSAMPEVPEEPTTAQIEAWVELAELVAEPDFRRRIRQMAQRAAEDRAAGRSDDASAGQATAMAVASGAGEAVAAGNRPASAPAATVVPELRAGVAASP